MASNTNQKPNKDCLIHNPQQPHHNSRLPKPETIAPPTLKSAPVNAMPIQNVNAVSQVQVKEIQTH